MYLYHYNMYHKVIQPQIQFKCKSRINKSTVAFKILFGVGCQKPFSPEETGATVTYITRMKYLKFTN